MVVDTQEFHIAQRKVFVDQAPQELTRLGEAIEKARQEIVKQRDDLAGKYGEEVAKIFDFHLHILHDEPTRKRMEQAIRDEQYSAPYAVSTEMRLHVRNFLNINDGYFSERVKDIYDVERRMLRALMGRQREDLRNLNEDVVIIAHDLTPSQTASLDRDHVVGFATDAGGRTSHTAILARALGIPAVVGLNDLTADVSAGDTLIIDGNNGAVVINPDEETLQQIREKRDQFQQFEHGLDELRDLPAVTSDGVRVSLLANIEFPDEVAKGISRGAEGIGLYRTEFLYLGSESEPTEEDHYDAYATAIQAAGSHPIIIRTLDLGADKYTQTHGREPERNPVLGCRSIRFCLRHPEIFRTQMRALLRATVLGDVRVMLPLVTTVMELRQAKTLIRNVMEDLEEEGIPFNPDVPIGIMVETPAAALKAHAFAQEVEFFSIGTNDLIQYTLAVDRSNERIASMYAPTDPAVVRLLHEVITIGHKYNIPVSVCGEVAGTPEFTLLLLGLGLRTFSMASRTLPEIKKIIRSVSMEQAQHVAEQVLRMDSDAQILSFLRYETQKILPFAL